MTDISVNQNIAECLKETNNFGGTTIHNVCSGATSFVPWGSLDWAGCALVIFLAAVFVGSILSLIGWGLFSAYESWHHVREYNRKYRKGQLLMTTPTTAITLRMPALDQDALERSILSQQEQVESVEIKTRTEVELESAESEASRLRAEGEDARAQIKRLEGNIGKLSGILEIMRANEQDIAVRLGAELAKINSLRTTAGM